MLYAVLQKELNRSPEIDQIESLSLQKSKLAVSGKLQLPREHVMFPLPKHYPCFGNLSMKPCRQLAQKPEVWFELKGSFAKALLSAQFGFFSAEQMICFHF